MERLIEAILNEGGDFKLSLISLIDEFLSGKVASSYYQSKMRGALLGWVSSIVEQYAIQIDTLDGKIQIQLADKSMSIEWSEADKLLDVIEAVKTEEGMIKLWEGME